MARLADALPLDESLALVEAVASRLHHNPTASPRLIEAVADFADVVRRLAEQRELDVGGRPHLTLVEGGGDA